MFRVRRTDTGCVVHVPESETFLWLRHGWQKLVQTHSQLEFFRRPLISVLKARGHIKRQTWQRLVPPHLGA